MFGEKQGLQVVRERESDDGEVGGQRKNGEQRKKEMKREHEPVIRHRRLKKNFKWKPKRETGKRMN